MNLEEGINIAIVAHPVAPPGPTGGAEAFGIKLPNALAEALEGTGSRVVVYGHDNPSDEYRPDVEYVAVGPSAPVLISREGVSVRRGTHEASVTAAGSLARDLAKGFLRGEQWVVIDNDITTYSIAPYLAEHHVPHIFINHSFMADHLFHIYQLVKESGAEVVAIADTQRESVTRRWGSLHTVTIKNGGELASGFQIQLQPPPIDEIQVGTLSRINPDDAKGIKLALEAVKRLRQRGYQVVLNITGNIGNQEYFDDEIAPYIKDGYARYTGVMVGADKSQYISGLHVGLALSNPGGWNGLSFDGSFEEGYSLVLAEMLLHGIIPISTDSGGAEALRDAGLQDFIVPLSVIQEKGLPAFLDLVGDKILEAANTDYTRREISAKARTTADMAREYLAYIRYLLSVTSRI